VAHQLEAPPPAGEAPADCGEGGEEEEAQPQALQA
jgi:hypothetical protein